MLQEIPVPLFPFPGPKQLWFTRTESTYEQNRLRHNDNQQTTNWRGREKSAGNDRKAPGRLRTVPFLYLHSSKSLRLRRRRINRLFMFPDRSPDWLERFVIFAWSLGQKNYRCDDGFANIMLCNKSSASFSRPPPPLKLPKATTNSTIGRSNNGDHDQR